MKVCRVFNDRPCLILNIGQLCLCFFFFRLVKGFSYIGPIKEEAFSFIDFSVFCLFVLISLVAAFIYIMSSSAYFVLFFFPPMLLRAEVRLLI